jgi:hypothetical protein
MKKLSIPLLLILWFHGYTQISLDFQTTEPGLLYFKLNNLETKYLQNDLDQISIQNQFSIYNLDGTLYKTIQMPQKPDQLAQISGIYLISQSLFDNDSLTIEYLVQYSWDSVSYPNMYEETKVIREDGTVLLSELNAVVYNLWPHAEYGAFATEEGAKLMLEYFYANQTWYQTKVFSLPGELATGLKGNVDETKNSFILYPNPNLGSFFIKFNTNPEGVQTIELLTINGKVINTYNSEGNSIKINNFTLSNGLYLINTRSQGKRGTTKMIINK